MEKSCPLKSRTSFIMMTVIVYSLLFTMTDAVNCCAVMSTNMVAFLLLNNHRQVSTCTFVVVVVVVVVSRGVLKM